MKAKLIHRALLSTAVAAVPLLPGAALSSDRLGLVGHRYNPFLALSGDELNAARPLPPEFGSTSTAKVAVAQEAKASERDADTAVPPQASDKTGSPAAQ